MIPLSSRIRYAAALSGYSPHERKEGENGEAHGGGGRSAERGGRGGPEALGAAVRIEEGRGHLAAPAGSGPSRGRPGRRAGRRDRAALDRRVRDDRLPDPGDRRPGG